MITAWIFDAVIKPTVDVVTHSTVLGAGVSVGGCCLSRFLSDVEVGHKDLPKQTFLSNFHGSYHKREFWRLTFHLFQLLGYYPAIRLLRQYRLDTAAAGYSIVFQSAAAATVGEGSIRLFRGSKTGASDGLDWIFEQIFPFIVGGTLVIAKFSGAPPRKSYLAQVTAVTYMAAAAHFVLSHAYYIGSHLQPKPPIDNDRVALDKGEITGFIGSRRDLWDVERYVKNRLKPYADLLKGKHKDDDVARVREFEGWCRQELTTYRAGVHRQRINEWREGWGSLRGEIERVVAPESAEVLFLGKDGQGGVIAIVNKWASLTSRLGHTSREGTLLGDAQCMRNEYACLIEGLDQPMQVTAPQRLYQDVVVGVDEDYAPGELIDYREQKRIADLERLAKVVEGQCSKARIDLGNAWSEPLQQLCRGRVADGIVWPDMVYSSKSGLLKATLDEFLLAAHYRGSEPSQESRRFRIWLYRLENGKADAHRCDGQAPFDNAGIRVDDTELLTALFSLYWKGGLREREDFRSLLESRFVRGNAPHASNLRERLKGILAHSECLSALVDVYRKLGDEWVTDLKVALKQGEVDAKDVVPILWRLALNEREKFEETWESFIIHLGTMLRSGEGFTQFVADYCRNKGTTWVFALRCQLNVQSAAPGSPRSSRDQHKKLSSLIGDVEPAALIADLPNGFQQGLSVEVLASHINSQLMHLQFKIREALETKQGKTAEEDQLLRRLRFGTVQSLVEHAKEIIRQESDACALVQYCLTKCGGQKGWLQGLQNGRDQMDLTTTQWGWLKEALAPQGFVFVT